MMLNPFRNALDRFFGDGRYAITVPPMDGPLVPNSGLDTAEVVACLSHPDNLVYADGAVYFSSSENICVIDESGVGGYRSMHRAAGKITALASSPRGQLAAGLGTGAVQLLSSAGVVSASHPIPKPCGVGCITSMAFASETSLIVCIGSRTHGAAAWARDLMERNASGCVLKLNLSDGSYQILADNLAFPSGVLVQGDRLLVSESWKHRLIEVGLDGGRGLKVVLDDLPAYPSRLCVHPGGYWLCLFAPRNQLIEFVLRERGYCTRMLKEVPPALWIAPSLHSNVSMHEPMQGGALRQLGILKPWAPTRSYGLVVELDRNLHMTNSLHSRADGKRHGITSAAVVGDSLWLTSYGGDAILSLRDVQTQREDDERRH